MTDEQIIARYAGTNLEEALVWANAQNGTPTENPPGATDMDRYEIQRVFLADGLISDEVSPQAEWELTGSGRRIAQRLQESRQAGPLRRASIQKALLRFIDDEEPSGTMDFIGKPVDGIPATEREVTKAVDALHGWGLISGINYSGPGLARPSVTPHGIEAADDPRTPIDFVSNGGTTIYDQRNTIENHGNINAAAAGNQVTQTGNTMHISETTELSATLAALRERLSVIDDVPEAATAALEGMEAEGTSNNPDKSKLQQMYMAFMTSIAVKLADQAFTGVGELSTQLGNIVTG